MTFNFSIIITSIYVKAHTSYVTLGISHWRQIYHLTETNLSPEFLTWFLYRYVKRICGSTSVWSAKDWSNQLKWPHLSGLQRSYWVAWPIYPLSKLTEAPWSYKQTTKWTFIYSINKKCQDFAWNIFWYDSPKTDLNHCITQGQCIPQGLCILLPLCCVML